MAAGNGNNDMKSIQIPNLAKPSLSLLDTVAARIL